jgi:hypothetical protein
MWLAKTTASSVSKPQRLHLNTAIAPLNLFKLHK